MWTVWRYCRTINTLIIFPHPSSQWAAVSAQFSFKMEAPHVWTPTRCRDRWNRKHHITWQLNTFLAVRWKTTFCENGMSYSDITKIASSEEFSTFRFIVNICPHHQGSDIRTLMKETELVSKTVGLLKPTAVAVSPKIFYWINLKTRGEQMPGARWPERLCFVGGA